MTLKREFSQYFKLEDLGDSWELRVGVVTWECNWEPGITNKSFRCWKHKPTLASLDRAHRAALKQRRFFKTCDHCQTLNNAGHMHNSTTCQSCAEQKFGVVY